MDLGTKTYQRILLVFGLITIAFGALVIQLVRIQLVHHRSYSLQAVKQRSRSLFRSERGFFVDREGRVIRGPSLNSGGAGKEGELNPIAWHLLGTYRQNSISGLEYSFDYHLRNNLTSGSLVTIRDGWHRRIQGLGVLSQTPGLTSIKLTLDLRVQKLVEQIMDREQVTGSVVVLNAQNGQIVAMASRPMVNLSNPESSLRDPNHPFLNRAISAYYPGSLFKLVILCTGLESGLIQPDEVFSDRGFVKAGDKEWTPPTGSPRGHGRINLRDALAYSSNPVFIEIAFRIGPGPILACAERFGLGQPCNIGLKDEAWGELPSGLGLSAGEQANMALGQSNVLATPLQIASLIQTIANNGVRNKPRLILGSLTANDRPLHWLEPDPPQTVLKPATARVVQTMMKAVIDYGTGQEARLPEGVAGKTGTAQSGNGASFSDYAWFAGYAPFQKPRFVTVVFCEKGVSGGKTAAPIFREIMDKVSKLRD
jgi:penicillin-binding protein 2